MTPDDILLDAEERMEKALGVFRDQLKGLRTGRANPSLMDAVRVEYYGQPTPVKQMANVTAPDPQTIVIKPFDPGSLKEIEKAIRASDLGLAPNNDGKVIRLTIPPMSGDQRNKLSKRVKELAEDAKVASRNVRRDANKGIDQAEKDGETTEDDATKAKDEVQALLKTFEGKIDDLAEKKTKEIQEQ